MLEWRIDGATLRIGDFFAVTFQRTLRIPDDGKVYPLPPGLGSLPLLRVDDYHDRVPKEWRGSWRRPAGLFLPLYQREAFWLHFRGPDWHPTAVKVGVGEINALTGEPLNTKLDRQQQDYLVAPDQPWLDGIKVGEAIIRQFVAAPLGEGYSVEGQVTGGEESGGLRLIVYEPKRGRFPDEAPPRRYSVVPSAPPIQAGLGVGAGGQMEQRIYPDPYGADTWDGHRRGEVTIHIVNSELFQEITGQAPPPTPVDAKTYTDNGLPWFRLYDERRGDLAASETLRQVKSTRQLDEERGLPAQQDDESVEPRPGTVKPIVPAEQDREG